MVDEFNQRPLAKVSNKIIDNRETMTYFEKHMLKYVFLAGLLAYLIYVNITNQAEPMPGVGSSAGKTGGSGFKLGAILADAQKEIVMFTLAVGGYILAAKYNNYLDRLEMEEEARMKA